MQHTRFRNNFLKNQTDEKKHQGKKFMFMSIKKREQDIFCQSQGKNITGDRKFQHTVKPFLLDKISSRESFVQ